MVTRRARVLFTVCTAAAAVAAVMPAQVASAAAPGDLTVHTVSAPERAVSGRHVLVRITGASDDLVLRLDGRPVDTREFVADPTTPGALLGRVSGLRPGRHHLTVRSAGADARTAFVDHPASGPVLAGRREQPFVCDTAAFQSGIGVSLGASRAPNCSVPTRVDYVYKAADGALHPLPSPHTVPADAVSTTTLDGRTVPYVVRVETGVIDRGIFEFAVLADPAAGQPTWQRPPRPWNGKLIYNFGGGCPGGWYQQGRTTGGVLDDRLIGAGYAVAASSLNVMGQNCDTLLSADVMAMTRQHVIDEIGPPRYTMGLGCSGGTYQINFIADEYPGLIDGATEYCTFADIDFATLNTITDALLLDRYVTGTGKGRLTAAQQRAVSGFKQDATVANLASAGERIDPRVYCPEQLPVDQRYDPVTNPHGARCDVYDHQTNTWGRDPVTGAALRPLDNRGVQYGLGAWQGGTIGADQFLDLNAGIGGFDADANRTAARTRAPAAAVRTAFTSDQLMQGRRLGDIPIIDDRSYNDDLPGGDIHLTFQSFTLRDRLIAANGDAGNTVIRLRETLSNEQVDDSVFDLDRWLTAIGADRSGGTAHERVVRNRPTDVTDACWTKDGATKIVETQVPGMGTTRCNTIYPTYTAPRQVAGAPLANDVVACTRVAPQRTAYPEMTDAQWARLHRVFPGGVCDWAAGDPLARPNKLWSTY